MQRKKNIALFVIFLALLAWTILFFNLESRHSGLTLDEQKFSIKDTAAIRKLHISGSGISNTLSKESGKWRVNEKYPMDPSMQKVLMSVLNQVTVKRTVPKNDLERIQDDVHENGFRVEITYANGEQHIFYAGGNGISLAYFMDDDNVPYIVYLPGYESYVTGIFEVRANDWRDRLIFQTSWLGIKSFDLSYPAQPGDNVLIEAENDLYGIPGINQLDTAELMGYLDDISYFFTDQYINHGQIASYDSLRNTRPFAQLRVDALGMLDPVTIDFFEPLPGENVMLGILNQEQLCLFDRKRIGAIFRKKSDFIVKK